MKIFLSTTLVLLGSLTPNLVHSTSLEWEGERSDEFSTNRLLITNEYEPSDKKLYFTHWLLSFSGSNSTYEESQNVEVETKATEFAGGFGLGIGESFSLDIYSYKNKSEDTGFEQVGAQVGIVHAKSDVKAPFTLGVGFGQARIDQHVEAVILNRLVERDYNMDQEFYEVSASLLFVDKLVVKIRSQFFDYSLSKDELQLIFPNNFLNTYAPNLINNIGGLPESSFSFQFLSDFSENWEFSYLVEANRLIVDDSDLRRQELFVTRIFEKWSLGLGGSQIETNQSKEKSLLLKTAFFF